MSVDGHGGEAVAGAETPDGDQDAQLGVGGCQEPDHEHINGVEQVRWYCEVENSEISEERDDNV